MDITCHLGTFFICSEIICLECFFCVFAYRLPGRVSVVRKLREAFDMGGSRPSLADVDVHSVASLLKSYLCDLPQPIIPIAHYDRVMHIVTRERPLDAEAAITALSDAIQQLPRVNYMLLRYLCEFLHNVAQFSEVNRMTATNLAMVFSPCIIKPEIDDPALLAGTAMNRTTAVCDMIEHFRCIFATNGDGESDAHVCSIPSVVDVTADVNKQETHSLLNGSVMQMPPDILMDAGHSVDELEENSEEINCSDLRPSVLDASDSVLPQLSTDTAEPVTEVDSQLVVMLQQQLQAERRSVCELHEQLTAERVKAARQAELMAKKLDEERTATASAVMRVVELQTKLQQYSVKYGLLD